MFKKYSYIYSLLLDLPGRLEYELKWLQHSLSKEPINALEKKYMQVYQLFESLSTIHQKKFSPAMDQLLDKIEMQLQAEKQVEELLEMAKSGNMQQKRKHYAQIRYHFKVLPAKVRRQLYPQLVFLKSELEREK